MTAANQATPTLADEDLPVAFRVADRISLDGQKRTIHWVQGELVLLVLASAAGALPRRIGKYELLNQRLPGLVSLALFMGAMAFVLLRASERPAAAWYRGRAGAESVKTLAWKFAVGGDPFRMSVTQREADLLFADAMLDVTHDLSELNLDVGGMGPQITERMREIRSSDLHQRQDSYLVGRIIDQQSWYSAKAEDSGRRASKWAGIALISSFVGVAGGVVRTIWPNNVDVLSIAATFSASATAWAETKQFRVLATSYALAAQELATISIGLPHVSAEDDWATFVNDAEFAISREHTLWRTRRGLKP